MNEHWRQQLKEKMADYQRPTPEVSWDAIDKALIARKTRRLWLQRIATAAAVLLLAAGVGYWVLQEDDKVGQQIVSGSTSAPSGQGGEPKLAESRQELTQRPPIIPPKKHATSGRPASAASHQEEEHPTSTPSQEKASPTSHQEREPSTMQDDNAPATPLPDGRGQGVGLSEEGLSRVGLSEVPLSDSPTPPRLTAQVYLSNTMTGSRSAEPISQLRREFVYTDIEANEKGEASDTFATNVQRQPEQHVHYHQPVRVGLSLRYRLNDRWSVESGLTYTHLVSDITTTVNGVSTMTTQRHNYIGLPLNVSCQLWTRRRFSIYATAGGMVEKMLDAPPWQFSVAGAAGVEYRLTKAFGLYVEPGVGYYFPNGSSIPTLYQDHPFNFNLSLGLRFELK